MPLTARQLSIRAKHIGASEVPAMLGEDPYMGPVDLWLRKTGRIPEQTQTSDAAEIGLMLEDALIRWAGKEIGEKVSRRNPLRVHPAGVLSCTLDGKLAEKPQGIQAKTVGILNPFAPKDEWGDAGSDQVPTRVILQTHSEMAAADLDRVWVPALIGGRGRVLFVVNRNEAIVAEIVEQARIFWDYIERDERPPGDPPLMDSLRAIAHNDGETCTIPDDIFGAAVAARRVRKEAEAIEERCDRALLEVMGTAEIGTCPLGKATYRTFPMNRIDTKALREAMPDVAEKFTNQTVSHRLTLKEA